MRFQSMGRAIVMSLLVLMLQFGTQPAAAQGVDGLLPVTSAFRLTTDTTTPGVLTLHWAIAPDYYLYRGRMEFTAGPGVTLGTAELPDGLKTHDEYLGDVETYHHDISARLPYTVAPGTTRLQLAVQYQGCHEVDPKICYPPHTEHLDLALPGTGTASPSAAGGGPAAATLLVAATRGDAPPPSGGTPAGANDAGAATAAGAQGPLGSGLLLALLLALGGGLLLNLMPCVLPVLSIKAVGVLEHGGGDRRGARRQALYYSAGVLASFALLGLGIVALRAAGHTLGWGSQLQQPLLVAALACVMLAVGLAMSGVVQVGASFGNAGAGLARRSGAAGDFFTGVLAVVVASPCTAPFMGAALAYAFTASAAAALLVFLTLGVGLALPFLLIAFVPAFGRWLPKPGRWMETLKQVLAFPMYLTAAWLVWVLGKQRGTDAIGLVLVAMVFLGMTLWWFERSRSRGGASKALVAALAMVTLVPMYLLAHVPPPSSAAGVAATADSVPYSPQRLAALRAANTPVFVDITADWCVTCKANEHTVLDTSAFRALLKRTGAVYMTGDWTNVDPVIGAFLAEYRSPGVPLYVVFPANGGPGKALSTVLTPSMVDRALTAAAGI